MAHERGGDPATAGQLMDALLGGRLGPRLSGAQKAARAWYAANGDRERQHTTGVWLRQSGRTGVDPVLVVAVDSNLLAAELGTNKDLYLSRLAFRGIHVSDLRFTVGKRDPARPGTAARSRGALAPPTPPPELSEAERLRVERACAHLPEGLKQSVSRAMCASLRRNKGKNT